jgi:nucleotide-binding universal stress UspA family protein
MYNKILVPLNGSTQSESVLPYAIRLATSLKAQLLLLRVVESTILTNAKTEERTRYFAIAQSYLESVEQTITRPDLALNIRPEQVETIITEGYPEQEIAFIAIYNNADLIVMATHGGSGQEHLVMSGDTTLQVLTRSKLPVVLIHSPKNSGRENLQQILTAQTESTINKSLVLTLDGSLKAETALTTATILAQQSGATLYLLRINPPHSSEDFQGLGVGDAYTYGREIAKENRNRREEAYSYLDKVQERIENDGLNCIKAVRISDNPALEIIKFAEEVKASAIVMTTDPQAELNRQWMGNIANQVIQHSHRPVIMIPNRPPKGGNHQKENEFYPLPRI